MRAWGVGLFVALLAGGAFAGDAPSVASKDDGGGGILYGKRHGAILAAPPGWIFDNESGRPNGLRVVLYRVGETWDNSPGVMYANGVDAPDDQPVDLDSFVAADLADQRQHSPGLQTFELAPLALPDGTPVRVVGMRGSPGNVEAIAFLPQPHAVVLLVLSARTQERFDRDLPDFREFVRSYHAMDVQVRDDTGA
jgi:hypothetical protein